jgi:hypothetical protein
MFLGLLFASLLAPSAHAAPARSGNQLSKRTQLRYQDVLTTRSGTRWRGKIIERGEVFRIRLDDNSEVAVPKAEVQSVTRELHPGYPHTGQWDARLAGGVEAALVSGTENAGVQAGPYMELGLGHNFGGSFEPELLVVMAPLGPESGSITPELGVCLRYYLAPYKRAKPFTSTQVIFYGSQGDLGLRTGPGFMFDLSPNIALGVSQGVTLMTQSTSEGGNAAGVGYHLAFEAQGRF